MFSKTVISSLSLFHCGGCGGGGGGGGTWWLIPRTPDLEVGGSSPTQVMSPYYVTEQDIFTSQRFGDT